MTSRCTSFCHVTGSAAIGVRRSCSSLVEDGLGEQSRSSTRIAATSLFAAWWRSARNTVPATATGPTLSLASPTASRLCAGCGHTLTNLGIAPDRIVAGGGSAGGHVAASTALLQGLNEPGEDASISSRPQALVLFNPVIDTTEKGYGAEKLGARQIEASPVHHVRPGLPPTIVFHGTADTTVPFENVERFCALMARAGNRCALVPYEGMAHGFFNRARDLDSYLDTTSRADSFLRALGLLR